MRKCRENILRRVFIGTRKRNARSLPVHMRISRIEIPLLSMMHPAVFILLYILKSILRKGLLL